MKADRVIAVRTNKTVYRDGDLCVKVFGRSYSKAEVLSEAAIQAEMDEAGIYVPRIKEVGIVDGKWAITSEYIRGKTLQRLIAECPEKKTEYIRLMVELQTSVHSVGCPPLRNMSDVAIAKINRADLSQADRRRLCALLDSMPRGKSICHGDFRPSNIIIAVDGTPYIIDWAHATMGDAAADAALTYLLFIYCGDADSAQYYLSLFCERVGVDEEYVKGWIPVVAASRSVDVNKEEREFMLSYLKEKKQ